MTCTERRRRLQRPDSTDATMIAIAALLLAVLLAVLPGAAQQSGDNHWVGTWATAVVGRPQNPAAAALSPAQTTQRQPAPAQQPAPFLHFSNQTLRQIVHVSIGGSFVRVVLTNAFGTAPLAIADAHIALRDKISTTISATDRALAFNGRSAISIPAGGVMFSDPVNLTVPPLADLAIDLYLPGSTNASSPLTMHNAALQTNYVSEPGDHAGQRVLPIAATVQNWFVLARVEVAAPSSVGAVVTMGASLTDGARSTPDTNNRWPDHLARRIATQAVPTAVLDEGIGGNRLLSEGAFQAGPTGFARFGRDVLEQTGVTHVIVADMALNDIGAARENPTPTAEDLIAAQKQLIERAHARGLKIYGATLTPFEGAGYFTHAGEAKRQTVNQWIRTGGAYDAVIDFDAATRDPGHPVRFLPQYDSGDHLHPNDVGYRAMADSIDLFLFSNGTRQPRDQQPGRK